MQETILIILIIVVFIVLAILTVSHAPLFPLKKELREKIKEHGVIHFTSPENASLILKSGCLKGSISSFEKILGPLVWTYQYNNEQEIDLKHNYLLKKKRGIDDPKNFSVCLIVTGFNDDIIAKTFTRHGIINDKPIVFKSNYIYPQNIEIVKEWEYED